MNKYVLLPAFALVATLAACGGEDVDPFTGKSFVNCADAPSITLNEDGTVTVETDDDAELTWVKVEDDDRAIELSEKLGNSVETLTMTLDEEGNLNFSDGQSSFTCAPAPEQTS